ncbi:MAG TPA: 3-hydroxyacyl-CoA dehydrogenase/enoyl-CoA hydratase family protein [Bacillota bacterium]|nr:3-hydroxyacyl-CoA dehydrogenase/enoyl-CoA hydratase family protein [Bacillota bacterium]
MKRGIYRAAVLGAGVMGSAIAAHLANVGIPSYLLDIVPKELTSAERARGLTPDSPEVRDRLAKQGIENCLKARPAAFFQPSAAELITPGNFEDHLAWLADVDWIIEAVVERLDIKQALWDRVAAHRRPGTLVSTNTSGISIRRMVEKQPLEFRQHFLGTHFFNPPRYMKLVELIPGPDTLPGIVSFMTDFAEDVLGKGVVMAKDTPNFIANRIGVFGMMQTMKAMQEKGYQVDEIDAVTGPAMGRPNSATFRTADLVGLDTLLHVAANVHANVPDEEKPYFDPPTFVRTLAERGWTGEKAGQGFYRKVKGPQGSEILALDWQTLEYRPQVKPDFPSLSRTRRISEPAERVKALVESDDRGGALAWELTKRGLAYAAGLLPEIADDVVSVDNAMKWGFGWDAGPFETWDALGVGAAAARMEAEGVPVAGWVKAMLAQGVPSFYGKKDGRPAHYCFRCRAYVPITRRPEVVILKDLKETRPVVIGNTDASLIDLGDGVACLEFHSPSQAISPDVIRMIGDSLEAVERDFLGLVIGNQARHFCVGANLLLVVMEAANGNWSGLSAAVESFQKACMALKYSRRPVVAAPHGMTLGGGAEIVLAAHRVVASAELYMGLVEFGVGLLPGGGGNKELLLRHLEGVFEDTPVPLDTFPLAARAFQTIAMAKVSTSAREAQALGLLRRTDRVVASQDLLLHQAKAEVLAMAAAGFRPPAPAKFRVLGETGLAALQAQTYNMLKGGHISEHDKYIADHIAFVLMGGRVASGTVVSEQYLLDLEREAFLDLCKQEKSQERMRHMVSTSKPLRN